MDIFSESRLPFKLSEAEQEQLNEVDRQISHLESQRGSLIKASGIRQGFIAANLADLKSDSGLPFVMNSKGTRAYARKGVEEAYLCKGFMGQLPENGCGWVKGSPREEDYDHLAPLAGSKGKNVFCLICGKQIDRHVEEYS